MSSMTLRVSALCLGTAAVITLGPHAGAQSPSPSPSPSPAATTVPVGWLCSSTLATALETPLVAEDTMGIESDVPEDRARFDIALKACGTLGEWEAATAPHLDELGGLGPADVAAERCADPSADLAGYQICRTFEYTEEELNPAPVEHPAEPGAKPPPYTAPPEPVLVAPPKRLSARHPPGTRIRWFEVRGRTPERLLNGAVKRTWRLCRGHAGFACMQSGTVRWKTRTGANGVCRVTSVTSGPSILMLPRWVGPGRVDRDLVRDWRYLVRYAAWHEAQHAKIHTRRVAVLRERLVGRRCGEARGIYRRWARQSRAVQEAFDQEESLRTSIRDNVVVRFGYAPVPKIP
jgi:predicted secreted Zn-dependent protease